MADEILTERFLDAADEPEQILTPVDEYQYSPLVSVKEAMEPIKSLIHNSPPFETLVSPLPSSELAILLAEQRRNLYQQTIQHRTHNIY
ncbi:hypothetical protein I4U23_026014 [Adineta vaga]|nr:hypothetical protein I4U23_026014 [Adineta vaga]